MAGVVPGAFQLGLDSVRNAEVFVPIGQGIVLPEHRVIPFGLGMRAIGRLRPSLTLEQAKSNMASVAHSLEVAYPEVDAQIGATVMLLKDKIVGDIRPYLVLLLVAVFLVLLIACVNVANLQLAGSMARCREFAVRLALGARASRILDSC